ncbi:hypothetical protein [Paenibacillus taiwanensis]|uniref:hypothetical protein n=1 Tax=Paenibacillus taiwanensis TaxID=401638 RepID=UPI000406A961|nr:hypothetical protein [Paenibacillus taiwanensis]
MKLKKILLTFVAATSVFAFSQSAFAKAGLADKFTEAIPLSLSSTFNMYLDTDIGDGDWYSYTNTSGQTQNIVYGAYPVSPSSGLNVDITILVQLFDGTIIPVGTQGDTGPGNVQTSVASIVPGTKVLWRVFGHNPYTDGGSDKPYTAFVYQQ